MTECKIQSNQFSCFFIGTNFLEVGQSVQFVFYLCLKDNSYNASLRLDRIPDGCRDVNLDHFNSSGGFISLSFGFIRISR